MPFKRLRFLFTMALAICLPYTASANSDADQLVKKLAHLESFSGQFQQTLIGETGEVLDESSGDFVLKRPGYFRWESKQPFPQLLISNLEKIWLYDPDLEQVTVRPYDEKLSRTPALLLSGDVNEITTYYAVKRLDESSYQLIPHNNQELFTQLNVHFIANQLVKMTLIDALNQQTVFTFSEGVYNRDIDPAQFHFVPPEGVDVIIGN